MKRLLLCAALAAPALAGLSPVPAPTAAAAGWRLAAVCRTYDQACCVADKLEDKGYDTCIKKQGNAWCVYCR